MPRLPVEDNNRMSLPIPASERALQLRAAALRSTGLTDFGRSYEAEHVQLSAWDSVRALEMLEKPPAPHGNLLASAKALLRK